MGLPLSLEYIYLYLFKLYFLLLTVTQTPFLILRFFSNLDLTGFWKENQQSSVFLNHNALTTGSFKVIYFLPFFSQNSVGYPKKKACSFWTAHKGIILRKTSIYISKKKRHKVVSEVKMYFKHSCLIKKNISHIIFVMESTKYPS